MPADGDNRSDEANIVRIKCFLNELCHCVSSRIPDGEFEDKWDKISPALVTLRFDPLEIGRLKTKPIDHDTERRVEEEVNKWRLDTEPRLEKLEQDVQQMKDSISRETPQR